MSNSVTNDISLINAPEEVDRIRRVVYRPKQRVHQSAQAYESASSDDSEDEVQNSASSSAITKMADTSLASTEDSSLVRIPASNESLESHESKPIEVGPSDPVSVTTFDANSTDKETSGADVSSEIGLPSPVVEIDYDSGKSVELDKADTPATLEGVDSDNGDHEYVQITAEEADDKVKPESEPVAVDPPAPLPIEVEIPSAKPEPVDVPKQTENKPTVGKVVEEKKSGAKCSGGCPFPTTEVVLAGLLLTGVVVVGIIIRARRSS